MNLRQAYVPGAASGARVEKGDDKWTLILVRDLRHPPALVWTALTDPAHLAEWAPFDADRSLGSVGPVRLSTAASPTPQVAECAVLRAEAPHLLEYNWGEQNLRWELEPRETGTRLTLWHNIDRRFIAWGAAGWHICLDVCDRLLAGQPIGRIVGPEATQFDWQRLNTEYAQAFGIASPSYPSKAPKG